MREDPPLPHLGWIVAAMALTAAFAAHAAWHGPYIEDDAGITFGYAWHIAQGNGPTLNPGEAPVEGYSNPTWTFGLAALVALGLFDPVWTPKLVAGVLALATGLLAVDTARRMSSGPLRPLHLLAPALLVANGSFVAWTVAGLENAIYGAFVLLGLWLRLRERERGGVPWSALAAVGITLSRPEGLAYALLIAGDAALDALRRRDGRGAASFLALFGVPLALYAAWHAATFVDPLPNTFYAKLEETELDPIQRLTTWTQPGWVYLREGILDWRVGWALIAGLGTLAGGDRLRRGAPLAWAMVAFSAFFVLEVGGDWMMEFRFLTPFYVLVAVLATAGLATAAPLGAPPWRRWSATSVAMVGLLWSASALPAGLERMTAHITMPMSSTTRLAESLLTLGRRLGVERPVVLQGAMGGPGWVSRGRLLLVDAFGLTDRTIARCLHRGCPPEELWAYAFDERRVHFANIPPVIMKTWRLQESPQFSSRYVALIEKARGSGSFVRRDLLFAPWDEAFVDGTVHEQGAVRVHAAEVLGQRDGEATVALSFSLKPGWTKEGLELRATLGGVKVRLRPFDAFPPEILQANAVYLDRIPVPVTEGQALDLVLGDGRFVPSDLPDRARDAPTRPADAEDEGPPALGGWALAPGDVECTPAKGKHVACAAVDSEKGPALQVVFAPGTPPAAACTEPLLPRGTAQIAGWVRVDDIVAGEKPFQTFSLDARWTGPDGRRLPSPGQVRRVKEVGAWTVVTLDATPPKGADRLRFCWTFLESSGTAQVAAFEIAGAEPAPAGATVAGAGAGARRARPALPKELKEPPALGGRPLDLAKVKCFPPGAPNARCEAVDTEKGPSLRLAFDRGGATPFACTDAFPAKGAAKLAGWVRLERLEAGEKPFQTWTADIRWFGADRKRIPAPGQNARFREVGPWKVLSLSGAPPAGAESVKFCWTFQESAGAAVLGPMEVAGLETP